MQEQISPAAAMEELIESGRILCNVEAHSKKHALEILSELLAGSEAELSHTEVFSALIRRERLGSTALGGGVAMPHGRAPGILHGLGAFMRLSDRVDFDAPDGTPVDLIFGMLVPEECNAAALESLRSVAEALADKQFREALRGGSSASAIHELLINHQREARSESELPPAAGQAGGGPA